MSTHTARLSSLDILRGLDLFVLLFIQPIVWAACDAAATPAAETIRYYFDHEVWQGFRPWDLVMPLFLFMTGAAIPFAFRRYLADPSLSRRDLWLRIFRRVVLLWILGMIVQGNLLSLDPKRFYVYTNTLQSIAAGYLIASVVWLCLPRRHWRIAATALLLIIYTIPMVLCGDNSPQGNFAYSVDLLVLGPDRGDITYTWIWSSLTFGVTVLTGAFAGEMMCKASDKTQTTLRLMLSGVALTVAGLACSLCGLPIIKRIWSASMTLYSSGLCFLLMAAFYYIIDCRGFSHGLNWLKIYGMNAITAYIIGEVINFRSIPDSLLFGLGPMLGDWYPVILTAANSSILLLILLAMHRCGLHLKV